MDGYNFWADLLASYRASPDVIKALWVLIPPAFLLGLVAVLRLTRRPARREAEGSFDSVGGMSFIPLRRYETTALPLIGFDDAEKPTARSPSR